VSDVKLGGRVLHDHDEELLYMGEDLQMDDALQERDPDLSSSFSVDPRDTSEFDSRSTGEDFFAAQKNGGIVLEDDIYHGGLNIQDVTA
jgi:hypothetical protein